MFSYLLLSLGLVAISILILITFRLKLPRPFILYTLSFILLSAMLIADTYLTALPIVVYNSKAILGVRLGSIPLEDFGYLIVVVLLVPALFAYFHHEKI